MSGCCGEGVGGVAERIKSEEELGCGAEAKGYIRKNVDRLLACVWKLVLFVCVWKLVLFV